MKTTMAKELDSLTLFKKIKKVASRKAYNWL